MADIQDAEYWKTRHALLKHRAALREKKLVDALKFYAEPGNYELYYGDEDADMNGAMNGKAKAVLQELNKE